MAKKYLRLWRPNPPGQPQTAFLRKTRKRISVNSPIKKAGSSGFIFLFDDKHISLFMIERYTLSLFEIADY